MIQKTFLVIVQHISTLLCTGTGWKAGEALPGVAHTGPHYHYQEQCHGIPFYRYAHTSVQTHHIKHKMI